MWFGILSIYFVYMETNYENHYAMACIKNCVKFFYVGTKIILGKLIHTMFNNVFTGTGSVIMMALLFVRLNDKTHGHGMYALANGFSNEGHGTTVRSMETVRSLGSAGTHTREPESQTNSQAHRTPTRNIRTV